MSYIIFIYLVGVLCLFDVNSSFPFSEKYDPEVHFTTPELIRHLGYPAETHTVETEDGYLLNIHRIPYSNKSSPGPRPVVYLQHGILSSSFCWLVERVALLFSDEGYDVWLGNIRGNTYSRSHTSLSPDEKQFWKFSWDEMAKYDLPAVIDYILKTTGQEKLTYIGHSMGTTIFFAMCSLRPEYNLKINLMVALAPVAYVTHMKSPIRYFAPFSKDLDYVYNLMGDGEILKQNAFLRAISKLFCDATKYQKEVCSNIMFLFVGYDTSHLDLNKLPEIFAHNPAGTSVDTINHYAQLISSENFTMYDYGAEKNMAKYNTSTPPKFNLSDVTVPVAIFSSDNDLLVDDTDLEQLIKGLPNIKETYRIQSKSFNHVDFVYAINVTDLVYKEVFRVMGKVIRSVDQKNNPQVLLIQ